MVNTDSIVTATFPTPDGMPRVQRGHRDRRGARHRRADRAQLRRPGRVGQKNGAADLTHHRHVFNGYHRDLRGQRDARRGGRRELSFGKTGYESIKELEAERGAQQEGPGGCAWKRASAMGLGDVSGTTVPEDLAGRPRRNRAAARLAPAPSSRSGCTSRSGCSARSASAPRSCSPARSAVDMAVNAAGGQPLGWSIEHPSGGAPGRGRARHHDDTAEGAALRRGAHRAKAFRRHRLPRDSPDS